MTWDKYCVYCVGNFYNVVLSLKYLPVTIINIYLFYLLITIKVLIIIVRFGYRVVVAHL